MNKRYWKSCSMYTVVSALAFVMMALWSVSASAQGLPVIVDRVLDGDTVTISGRPGSVRLSNIDAPESSHGYGKPGQSFSIAAGNYLQAQVQGVRGITMLCIDRDRYGRDVCELFRDGRSVNAQLVASGYAWANTSAKGRYLRDKSLIGIQDQARNSKRGLWAKDSPSSPATPPWEWRDVCWKQGVCLVPQQ